MIRPGASRRARGRTEKAMKEYYPVKEGKVREIYDVGDNLILVATDRISCFDVILKNTVDLKGVVLTQMSKFWFDYTSDIVKNHMVSTDPADMPEFFRQERFAGRSMMVKKLKMLPVECIVRGYITGSGWKSYLENGTVCGIKLPEGLVESQKLPEPLYTPSTKADLGDHDENISFEQSVDYLEKRFPGNGQNYAEQLRDLSLAIYKKCAAYALEKGIIIADTKFEFGLDEEGKVVVGDEMLTPDSSRFWPADVYEPGHSEPSYDKQFARDWLKAHPDGNWTLPQEVVDRTIAIYLEGCERLTGSRPDKDKAQKKNDKSLRRDRYTSPFSERYASAGMQYIFSQEKKFTTWRRLWVALAETEMELGLERDGKPVVTREMIDELKSRVDDVNYADAERREREVRHDVMSHVYAYGLQCPKAAGIIHLGATSCYVGDNTDIIIMRDGLRLLRKKLLGVIDRLAKFADSYRSLPTLAFTHFQPAQPTTVGKRATLWIQEFMTDLGDLDYVLSTLRLLGCKGTTGTQASFLELFDGDAEKVAKIDRMIAEKTGFPGCVPVSGQTYSRKTDTRVMNVLAGIAASAHKMSNDIRLLQHLKEVEEPFEKNQIGSSAMAYKRNPMRSERIASLSRYLIVDALNPAITSASQWFERTLDDSANKRIAVAEGFLAADGILDLCMNVTEGLVVNEKVIEKHLKAELPFMATENIMMDAVKRGGNRQELHEEIRKLSMQAGAEIKREGKENRLLELIAGSEVFGLDADSLEDYMDPSDYIGLADVQTAEYLSGTVLPLLEANRDSLGITADIKV